MKKFIFIVLCASFASAQVGESRADEAAILRQPVKVVENKPLSTVDAFRAALSSVGVPGGSVAIRGCEQNAAMMRWNANGVQLDHFLNDLVISDPSYRWEFRDHSINIMPVAGEPPLLQTQIADFNVRTDSSIEALSRLQNLPEIKSAMKNLQLEGGLAIVMYLSNSKELNLHLKGGTFREALNTIAASKGRDIWRYEETHCGKRNEVTITF